MKKMKKINQILLLVFCACFFGLTANAQTGKAAGQKADIRIANALSQANTGYEVDKEGMYKITYKTQGNRTQTALIASNTEKIFGIEMRLVFSFAQIEGQLPSAAITNLLLKENLENVPQVWAMENKNGKYTISCLIYVSADADGPTLDLALSGVMIAADKMEKTLSKEDKL